MSQLTIFFFLFPFHTILSIATPSTDFIKTECQSTHYPSLCIQCLSAHSAAIRHSPKQLAITALSISLSRTQSVTRFITAAAKTKGLKPVEYQAMQDCTANMANAEDQLTRSMKELASSTTDSQWRASSIKSWITAAVTFHYTCLDGFASPVMDGKVKNGVRERVVDCAHVTSNSLALVQRAAARRKFGGKVEGSKVP